ncbi:unnamed protein product [Peniophora sp. CBMAI 1063]|nr:unnamed protein product [Peniophora sp. CBMAI 1063]
MSYSRPLSMFASSSTPKARPPMIEVFPEGSDGGLPPTSRIWEEGIRWHSGAYTAAWASPKLMVVYECIRTHVSHNNNNPLYDRGYYWRRASPSLPPAPEEPYTSTSSHSAPSSPSSSTPARRLHPSSVPASQAGAVLSKVYAAASVPIFTPATNPDASDAGRRGSNTEYTRSASSTPPSPNYQLQAAPALFAEEPRGGVSYTQANASAQYGRGQGLGNEPFPPIQATYGYA